MILNFNTDMLELLSDGVILLDPHGQVTDFNNAAKPWLRFFIMESERIKGVMKDTLRDSPRTPCVLLLSALAEVDAAAAKVRLCFDGKNGFALMFTPLREVPAKNTDAWQRDGISHLISDAIRHEFTDLIRHLEALQTVEAVACAAPVKAHAQHLRSMFVAMDQLSRLAQVVSMYPGERMAVPDLLTAAIGAIPFSHCEYFQNAAPEQGARAPGPVYGSRSWMECALSALLQRMEAGAPRRSQIHLTTRQNGNFVLIHAKNPIGSNLRGVAPVQPDAGNEPVLHLVASTQVPLARRIIEMHGGKLQVQEMDSASAGPTAGIESFSLQLPTGVPVHPRTVHCEGCTVQQQAETYARDLAKYSPFAPREAILCEEEIAHLATISNGP